MKLLIILIFVIGIGKLLMIESESQDDKETRTDRTNQEK